MGDGATVTTLPTARDDMSFRAAAELALSYLSEHVPVALWTVTRVENNRQTVLVLDDTDQLAGAEAGLSVPWERSFCLRMASGAAPPVAGDVLAHPAYAEAAHDAVLPVAAYAGATIREADGRLFGTICGIDTVTRDGDGVFESVAPLLELLGGLLGMVLAAERRRDSDAAALLAAQLEAETDELTGLYNRRAWVRVIEREESRFRHFADPTAALVLDLDRLKTVNDTEGHDAGDAYIRLAARTLRGAVREDDVVARLGGDEFGVLMLGCTEDEAAGVVRRIYAAFEAAGVAGSVGWAPMTLLKGFPEALAEADAAMYAAKAERRGHLRDAGLGSGLG